MIPDTTTKILEGGSVKSITKIDLRGDFVVVTCEVIVKDIHDVSYNHIHNLIKQKYGTDCYCSQRNITPGTLHIEISQGATKHNIHDEDLKQRSDVEKHWNPRKILLIIFITL